MPRLPLFGGVGVYFCIMMELEELIREYEEDVALEMYHEMVDYIDNHGADIMGRNVDYTLMKVISTVRASADMPEGTMLTLRGYEIVVETQMGLGISFCMGQFWIGGKLILIRYEEEIENYCIVKLVIQPILENAIYYGVGNMDEDDGGMIIVSGKKKDEDILITIEDNGMGMREEVLENILTDNSKVPKHGSGVGVINVHSRIRLMFGEEYGLSIESEPDEGTRVTIRIPAIPYTPENAEALELQKYIQRRPGR